MVANNILVPKWKPTHLSLAVAIAFSIYLLLLPPCLGLDSEISNDNTNTNIHPKQQQNQTQKQQSSPQPNFVIILTDDLDWTLGGANASTLARTREFIGNDNGLTFSNWLVQTPVCCPSRAELLTGKMLHNLRLPSFNYTQGRHHGCMHIDVQDNASHKFYKRDYFAQYFSKLNYTVGYFGKHLNNENPSTFLPPGVDEMLLNGGGVYMNPTFTVGTRGGALPRDITFDNCTESTGMPCYSTSIIGNASLAWMTRHLQQQPLGHKPFFAMIAPKAPHLLDQPGGFPLSIPAPWYTDTQIPEEFAPRTPHYNYSAQDHHWLVRSQKPLTQVEAQAVDDLYVSRLKTMMSVDDLVVDLMATLDKFHVLDNTYVVFTSDHGYRLGQFRLPCGKFQPYENDLRVPMMMRGPNLPVGSTSDLLATHVDLMPTLLGLATRQFDSQEIVPSTMDGTNLAGHIVQTNVVGGAGNYDKDDYDEYGITIPSQDKTVHNHELETISMQQQQSQRRQQRQQRPTEDAPHAILVEYMSLGPVFRYNHTVDTYNHTFLALRILMPTMQTQSIIRHKGPTDTATATPPPSGWSNYKYVEFRDSRTDWNCTQPPLEREFYNLEDDPNEMRNLIRQVSPDCRRALQRKMKILFYCRGDMCRQQQRTVSGLYPCWYNM